MQRALVGIATAGAITLASCSPATDPPPLLADDTQAAAEQCWVAIAKDASDRGAVDFGTAAEVTYLSAQVIPAATPYVGFVDALGVVTNEPSELALAARDMAAQLAPLCRERFPELAANVVPALPADPAIKSMWCFQSADLMVGFMRGMGQIDYPEKGRLNSVMDASQQFLDDAVLASIGITTTEQYQDKGAELVRDALLAGRLDAVLQQCDGWNQEQGA